MTVQFLLLMFSLVTPVMMKPCQLTFNQTNKGSVEVFKQNGTKDITVDYTEAILPADRKYGQFDYIQIYKNGMPELKFNKGKIGRNEHYESSEYNTTFVNWDICEKFKFEAKFLEIATHCEKISISKEYDPADFFDWESAPDFDVGFAGDVTSVTVFSNTNLVSDNDFLVCISKYSLSYNGTEVSESEKGIFMLNITNVRSCENSSFEVTFTLRGDNKRLTKSFDLNICPYIRPVWQQVLMYSVVGVVCLAIMLTVAVLVYRKVEERQFLDVVVDYGVMEDTQDVKYLQ